jgi:hypothetical protein
VDPFAEPHLQCFGAPALAEWPVAADHEVEGRRGELEASKREVEPLIAEAGRVQAAAPHRQRGLRLEPVKLRDQPARLAALVPGGRAKQIQIDPVGNHRPALWVVPDQGRQRGGGMAVLGFGEQADACCAPCAAQ